MGDEKAKRAMASLFWGRMESARLPTRVAALVFVLVAIVAMSFCQLGFLPIGIIDGKPVYLLLVLAPLVMGAFMFGPLTGALLGLYTGTVVFLHATILPLDFYEMFFMTPLNAFVLITVVGALSGLLIDRVLKRELKGGVRFGLIALMCLALSFAASLFLMAGVVFEYSSQIGVDAVRANLFNTPLGVITQAIADAVLMMLLCCLADAFMRRVAISGDDRTLLSRFYNWMLLVSAIVFMLTSAAVFATTTSQARAIANASMMNEVDALAVQADALEGSDLDILLESYKVKLNGYVVITDKDAKILATNSEKWFPVGASFVELIGYGDGENYDVSGESGDGVQMLTSARQFMDAVADRGRMCEIQATDDSGVMTLDFAFLAVGRYDGGFTAMFRTADMVFENRFGTMLAITVLAILLIAAISILAIVLLNRIVVRRIGETNDSLAKITDGNLSERVTVHDSREFVSLSKGINTTVSALKDTINEVEQRNAQDLATAKAIQESALPRDFPPFPEIDRFDIYASMKTAKEVGGDFYDFFLVEDSDTGMNRLGFVMADVSGKGIPASLFMMAAMTQIRDYMEAGLPVNEAVGAANHQLCIGNDAGMFVTAWVGVLDYGTGLLSYVNAGHNPPLLLHDRKWEWIKDVSGMPLGLFDGIPYDRYERQLEVGDMLYAYTDGVTEAMDADGKLFGEERLEETLYKYADFNPRSVGVGVRRALTDYTLDAEQSDDITMLILKYGVPPEKKAVMILPADVKQLVHVCNFIHEELKRRRAPKSVYNPLDIAAEELFVNVCHYAYPDATPENPGEVRISFEYEATPPSLTVTIADDGVPYNPLSKPDAVTPDDIADVPIGGLGILMAKRSVDDMTYERVGDSNVLTFRKGW